MKLISVLFLTLCCVFGAKAADAVANDTIRGIVVNAKGKPVKKAQVSIGEVKAETDKDGFFQLNGVSLDATVTISQKKNSAQVAMRGIMYPRIQVDGNVASVTPDNESIMKLILRSAKKSKKTQSNSIVSGEELVETGFDNLLEALAGKVSGVTVFTDDEGNTHAKIRGMNSTTSNHALYIVDNVETDRLDNYNVNDVKQVEILKESNIYGARGGSGVIIVTLK